MAGRKRRHDPQFRADVARRIRAKVKELRKDGVSEAGAARQIQVTPQGFNRYVRGLATPKPEILARICATWGLKFTYRSKDFGAEAFSAPETPRDERKSEQLSLFDE